MDSGIAGLIGAGIGALAGIARTLITNHLQAKQERLKWLRDRHVESYSNSIRYLTRTLNKRSSLDAEGRSVIGKEIVKEWFDDLSEALVWLSSLSIYCSESQQKEVIKAFRKVDQAVTDSLDSGLQQSNLQSVISSVLDSIVEGARQDIGRTVK